MELEPFYCNYQYMTKQSNLIVYFIIQWKFDRSTWNLQKIFPRRSPFTPKIFRHISLTRDKWHYGEHDVIVIDPDTQIFKQLISSFEHITSIYRSTFLQKKVIKFIRYHRKRNIKFNIQFLTHGDFFSTTQKYGKIAFCFVEKSNFSLYIHLKIVKTLLVVFIILIFIIKTAWDFCVLLI